MDRQRQIELVRDVEERTSGYVRKWLQMPDLRAALRSRRDDNISHEVLEKVRVIGAR